MAAADKNDRSIVCTYKTAFADVLIGRMNRKKIMSVMVIVNNKEGNGCAWQLLKYLDGYARQCRCKEIWFPTVLNIKLLKMLIKRGFKLQIHKDELFGRVEVFVKVFKSHHSH